MFSRDLFVGSFGVLAASIIRAAASRKVQGRAGQKAMSGVHQTWYPCYKSSSRSDAVVGADWLDLACY